MEIENQTTSTVLVEGLEVVVPGSTDVVGTDTKALDITFTNNEYNIVGDDMVVLTKYDDAPQWLQDTIDNIVNMKTAIAVGDLEQVKESLDIMLGELDVAKNTYQLSIISSDDIDSRINTAITTLNSSLQEADATILQIAQTATTPEEAHTISLNVLSASLSSNGTIGSAIHNLQTAMATLDSTTAESLSYLSSVMEGEINGNAEAMQTIRTYVGISEDGGITGTGMLADLSILQKQNDGIIETVTGTYDVIVNPQDPNLAELVLTAEPYASWKAADSTDINTRLAHIGDVYIKYGITDNGARQYIGSYKFIRTVVDTSDAHKSTDADGFTWALITDQAAQDAYNQALNAYDLADSKRRVFTNTPFTPIDEGDLWVTGTNPQVTKVYKSGAWVIADTQVSTFVSSTYTPTVASLQSQLDGKIESWYTVSSSDPKTAWTTAEIRLQHNGDMWYQTDTKKSYWYSNVTHSWNLIEDQTAITALANAATAQASADGVVVSFYAIKQDTAPATTSMWLNKTGIKVLKKYTTSWVDVPVQQGDTLTAYDPSTKDISIYVYSNSGWITNTENGMVANSESITKLTAYLGTDGGTSTLVNDITSKSNDLGKSVDARFAYNSSVVLNGVTYSSGFGLATSINDSSMPAGSSEFWVTADKFKISSATNNAYQPFSISDSNIMFNGKVSFSNVTDTSSLTNSITTAQNTADTANSNALARPLPSEVAAAINNNTTTVNGSKLTTGTIAADKLSVSQLSSITANLGTITTGKIQNSTGTNFVDMNATGTNSFLKVGSNVDIKADGSGVFARTLISEPNVIASGVYTPPSAVGSSFDIIIDTGVQALDPGNWYESSKWQYLASATISGGVSYSGGGNGYGNCSIWIGDGLMSSGTSTVVDGRIYIRYQYNNVGPGYLLASSIDWKLVRV